MDNFDIGDIIALGVNVEPPSTEPVAALEKDLGNHAVVSIGPLPAGWGVTIGNPLRRLLYRAPRGYALAGVAIEDFSIDEVGRARGTLSSPDEIVLALRSVRVAFRGEPKAAPRAIAARIEARGDADELLSSDVSVPPDFEIVGGPERIALLSDSPGFSASLSYLLGKGYQLAPEGGDPGAGRFLTDRAFSPVVRADYQVERMRVGAITNFEKLVVSVWTNGTLDATAAIRQVASRLASLYSWISDWSADNGGLAVAPDAQGADMAALLRHREPVERLDVGARAVTLLRRVGAETVADVLACSREDLLMLRGFGEGTYRDLVDAVERGGYTEGLAPDSHWVVSALEARRARDA